MNQNASTIHIKEDNFYLEVYLDPFNKRIRIDVSTEAPSGKINNESAVRRYFTPI
jgi:hypothetical protein